MIEPREDYDAGQDKAATGQVHAGVNRLQSLAMELDEAVAKLQERIDPVLVLAPAKASVAGEPLKDEPALCSLAVALEQVVEKLCVTTNRVVDMHDRLAL